MKSLVRYLLPLGLYAVAVIASYHWLYARRFPTSSDRWQLFRFIRLSALAILVTPFKPAPLMAFAAAVMWLAFSYRWVFLKQPVHAGSAQTF